MQYLAVEWQHDALDYPVHIYLELDANRYERRKVEEYRDGTIHAADASQGQGTTFLACEPHPPLAEIEKDPEFCPREIAAQEFEVIWNRARQAER